ncbi:MAG: helix-turn-helix domain-containing protein [Solirubrobacteraceae bacterium]
MNGTGTSGIDLLKPSEVATRLRVSRTWLYDAAKQGRIPSIRIGGEEGPLRFHPDDIERWVNDARAAWSPGRSAQPTATVRPAQRVPARGLTAA